MADYTQEELKGLQQKSLEMALYFVDFCKRNNLLCYFCGGGCIGAIRHKGFIPWDDDLDFFMPRDDYEKLKLLWKNQEHERYKISFTTENYKDRNIFITVRDSYTTYVKDYQQDLDIVHGIVIDIFPLDGYPNKKLSRLKQTTAALVGTLFCTDIVPTNHGKLMQIGSWLLLKIVPSSLHYKIFKLCEGVMSKYKIEDFDYITELYAGPGYMKKKYPKEAFLKAVFVDFENTKMPIPVGYDAYLTEAFGDYMKLPPVEKRISHHECVLMDLSKSYKR